MQRVNNCLNVNVSSDGMEARLIMSGEAYKSKPISYEDALRDLKEYIKFGLMEDELKAFMARPSFDREVVIANGKKPVSGKDGEVKYNFDISASDVKPRLLDDGTVDYKNLDSIKKTVQGALLAEVIPPVDGENGMNVYGKEIPFSPGKPKAVKGGKNTVFSEDKSKLYAVCNGLVRLQDGKVVVENTYTVDAIGVASGNIDFDGSVIVKTDVLTGFVLKATGAVEVRGKVEGGEIFSSSDIVVKGGIQGYSKYRVETSGSLHSKFLENAVVSVGGDIFADAIMHSSVSSGGTINCTYNKGLIVGGSVKAKKEISAKIVGSSMATKTELDVGVDPKSKELYLAKQEFIKENEPKLRMLISNITVFESMIAQGQLDPSKKPVYDKLVLARDSLMVSLEEAKREVADIEEDLKAVNTGKIRVSDIIYPGVKISIGDAFLFIRDEMKACSFYKDGPDIRVGAL